MVWQVPCGINKSPVNQGGTWNPARAKAVGASRVWQSLASRVWQTLSSQKQPRGPAPTSTPQTLPAFLLWSFLLALLFQNHRIMGTETWGLKETLPSQKKEKAGMGIAEGEQLRLDRTHISPQEERVHSLTHLRMSMPCQTDARGSLQA